MTAVMPSVPCFVGSLLWSHFTLQQWKCSAGMCSRIKTLVASPLFTGKISWVVRHLMASNLRENRLNGYTNTTMK